MDFGVDTELFDNCVVLYDAMERIPDKRLGSEGLTCRSENGRIGFLFLYHVDVGSND